MARRRGPTPSGRPSAFAVGMLRKKIGARAADLTGCAAGIDGAWAKLQRAATALEGGAWADGLGALGDALTDVAESVGNCGVRVPASSAS